MPKLWVDLDPEVQRELERRRRRFDDSLNDVLRRVLGIEEAERRVAERYGSEGRPWRLDGVILPHGTELRWMAGERVRFGLIEHGRWVVDGCRYDRPPNAIRRRGSGGGPPTLRPDEWIGWNVRLPGEGRWRTLNSLRPNGRRSPEREVPSPNVFYETLREMSGRGRA